METLVVRLGGRYGRVAELARSHGSALTVGRGYENDLVLTDLHVGPRQLVFRKNEDQWLMRVLDHTNPVLLNNKPVEGDVIPVSSGDQVTVGRTRLALYAADHPVEQTRRLVLSNWLTSETIGPMAALLVLLVASALDLILNFFENSTDLDWALTGYTIGFSAFIILVWAGIWAVAGRIVRQQHHFGLQLAATAVVSLLATVISLAATYIAYPFHSFSITQSIGWMAGFVTLLILLHLNLLIATNMRNPLPVAAVFSALLVGVSYAFMLYSFDDESHYVPEYSSTLLPPPLTQIFPANSVDAYYAQLEQEMSTLKAE